ncbi:MAG: NUDIX domain-containing protein [bacterium]
MEEDQAYWVGQKAFIRKEDDVLVLTDPAEGLDFPGGKIQEGEIDLAESLKREVKEESGLEIEVGEPFAVWQNTFPAHHKYAGKKVYLIAFRCNYISGDVTLNHEHNKFRWVNKKNYHEADDGTQYFEILDKYFKS